MALFIEHTAGAFPVWLAPVQAVVIPIAERHRDYSQKVEKTLINEGFRVKLDDRNEKTGYKIREAQLQKIPFMLVVGDREVDSETVAVRSRSEGDRGASPLSDFIAELRELVTTRALEP
jgi:threonyl-tRNA synthetase